MPESRLDYLIRVRHAVANNTISADDLKRLRIESIDGQTVRLNDAQILVVLDQRIAAERLSMASGQE